MPEQPIESAGVSFAPSVTASKKLDADIVTPKNGGYSTDMQAAARRDFGVLVEKQVCDRLGTAFLERLKHDLKAGRHVSIQGFGSFNLFVKRRRDGSRVLRVRFEPAKELKIELEDIRC